MSHSTSNTLLDGFSRRSFVRVLYLGTFLVLYYGTSLFQQYEALLWLALLGLVVVFFDAVICARRRWRVVKNELGGDSSDDEPSC